MIFSITTPNYNGWSGLRQCIGSVRNQTDVAGDLKIRHHIQDGQSSDQSVSWLQENVPLVSTKNYALTYASVADEGMYDAINKGWKATKGNIYGWLNHDEQYLPGTIKEVARVFSENPDIDVVWGDYICVDPAGNPLAARREIDANAFLMKYCSCYIASCTVFFRGRLLNAGSLYLKANYKLSADRDLFLRLLMAKTGFFHMKRYLSLFTVSSDNLSLRYPQQVRKEDQRINKEHGLSVSPFVVSLANIRRYVAKLICGSYRSVLLEYAYMLNEQGACRRITVARLSCRHPFRLSPRYRVGRKQVSPPSG